MIWLPEHRGRQNTAEKRLLGFNSKTEEWTQQISMDPDKWFAIRLSSSVVAMDSKGNIYVGWIMGGALSKWDRETR
ncbi:MAG: hypothetical protein Ct9H300mP25_15430 [Acidobacteriota bacterium]|nr:MAG: hypothetical protein Ct9H300mP25_15430 [Acidobacteriota bacterium]